MNKKLERIIERELREFIDSSYHDEKGLKIPITSTREVNRLNPIEFIRAIEDIVMKHLQGLALRDAEKKVVVSKIIDSVIMMLEEPPENEDQQSESGMDIFGMQQEL